MNNKKIIKTCMMVFILLSIPSLAFADTASNISSIDGAQDLINLFDVYVRGAGVLILFFGVGEMFMNMAVPRLEIKIKSLLSISGGLFLICSYPIICAVCDIKAYDSFKLILSIISIFFEFIGAMLAFYGAYSTFRSLNEQNAEAKYKAIKILMGGLAVVAIAQSSFSFLI